jgi:hypothetical protein
MRLRGKNVIYLIGCDHDKTQSAPRGIWDDNHNIFAAAVLNVIQNCNIVLIAEEEHPCYLKQKGLRSVAFDVLTNMNKIGMATNITHRFCDPSPTERKRLGIYEDLPHLSPGSYDSELLNLMPTATDAYKHEIGHRWPIRENYWIKQLGCDLNNDVLFICGALHRMTFKHRLEAKEIKVKIVAKRVGHSKGAVASELNFEEFSAYKEVARKGFPLEIRCPCVKPLDETQANFL